MKFKINRKLAISIIEIVSYLVIAVTIFCCFNPRFVIDGLNVSFISTSAFLLMCMLFVLRFLDKTKAEIVSVSTGGETEAPMSISQFYQDVLQYGAEKGAMLSIHPNSIGENALFAYVEDEQQRPGEVEIKPMIDCTSSPNSSEYKKSLLDLQIAIDAYIEEGRLHAESAARDDGTTPLAS